MRQSATSLQLNTSAGAYSRRYQDLSGEALDSGKMLFYAAEPRCGVTLYEERLTTVGRGKSVRRALDHGKRVGLVHRVDTLRLNLRAKSRKRAF